MKTRTRDTTTHSLTCEVCFAKMWMPWTEYLRRANVYAAVPCDFCLLLGHAQRK